MAGSFPSVPPSYIPPSRNNEKVKLTNPCNSKLSWLNILTWGLKL